MNAKQLILYECNCEAECNTSRHCIKNEGPCHMTKDRKYSMDDRVSIIIKDTERKKVAKPIERKNNENR